MLAYIYSTQITIDQFIQQGRIRGGGGGGGGNTENKLCFSAQAMGVGLYL